jgi:hypothetical protein
MFRGFVQETIPPEVVQPLLCWAAAQHVLCIVE